MWVAIATTSQRSRVARLVCMSVIYFLSQVGARGRACFNQQLYHLFLRLMQPSHLKTGNHDLDFTFSLRGACNLIAYLSSRS